LLPGPGSVETQGLVSSFATARYTGWSKQRLTKSGWDLRLFTGVLALMVTGSSVSVLVYKAGQGIHRPSLARLYSLLKLTIGKQVNFPVQFWISCPPKYKKLIHFQHKLDRLLRLKKL
jgi:hypothetical protein